MHTKTIPSTRLPLKCILRSMSSSMYHITCEIWLQSFDSWWMAIIECAIRIYTVFASENYLRKFTETKENIIILFIILILLLYTHTHTHTYTNYIILVAKYGCTLFTNLYDLYMYLNMYVPLCTHYYYYCQFLKDFCFVCLNLINL